MNDETPWNDPNIGKEYRAEQLTPYFDRILEAVRRAHALKPILAAYLEYTRPEFDPAEFPERGHGGFCTPESGCDTACAEIFHMSEYNRLRKLLEEFVKNGPNP